MRHQHTRSPYDSSIIYISDYNGESFVLINEPAAVDRTITVLLQDEFLCVCVCAEPVAFLDFGGAHIYFIRGNGPLAAFDDTGIFSITAADLYTRAVRHS